VDNQAIRRWCAVKHLQRDEEELSLATGGFGLELLGEACRAEETEYSAGRVMPGRIEQVTEVLEPAKLS
jgi:hypothetical protein